MRNGWHFTPIWSAKANAHHCCFGLLGTCLWSSMVHSWQTPWEILTTFFNDKESSRPIFTRIGEYPWISRKRNLGMTHSYRSQHCWALTLANGPSRAEFFSLPSHPAIPLPFINTSCFKINRSSFVRKLALSLYLSLCSSHKQPVWLSITSYYNFVNRVKTSKPNEKKRARMKDW